MHNLTAPQEHAVVRAELSELMHAFFDAVSFERDAPPYDELRELFVAGAGLINNTADVLEGTRNGLHFRVSGLISTQFIRTADGWRISSMAWEDTDPRGA